MKGELECEECGYELSPITMVCGSCGLDHAGRDRPDVEEPENDGQPEYQIK